MKENNTDNLRIGGMSKKLIIIILAALLLVGFVLIRNIQDSPNGTQTSLQKNVFYLATHKDKPVIFYSYEGIIVPEAQKSPSAGHFIEYDPFDIGHQHDKSFVDFQKLHNPQKLFTFDHYAAIVNVQMNDEKTHFAMSYIGGPMDATNYIYQIDRKTLQEKKIWEHELRSGDFPYNGGMAYVNKLIADKYVVFSIIKGSNPLQELPAGVVVKNLQSGAEKVLGVAGDLQIDLKNKSVSYKIISETKVLCEGENDPDCFAGDTYKRGYAPSGQVLTQPLP